MLEKLFLAARNGNYPNGKELKGYRCNQIKKALLLVLFLNFCVFVIEV